jgi:prophage tail gpP-like protein
VAVDFALKVNGRRYIGWESIRVTLSIETLAGSFALEVSDRWGGDEDPLPIVEEDECEVEIGGKTLITGFIDAPEGSVSGNSRTLSFTGKDRAAAIVECSAVLQGGSAIAKPIETEGAAFDPTKHGKDAAKYIFANIDVVEFARQIARPHRIPVSVQPGLTFKPVPKIVISPGDKGWDSLRRVAETAGVLVVSDGVGGIRITRAGTARAAQLTEGDNILTGSFKRDATNRYRTYVVSTQMPGTDEASGEATQIQASATDEDVRRASRILMILPDKGYSTADARKRADWEARNRAARAMTITVGVQGWRQPNGELWPLNALTRVKAPRSLRVDGDMLISQVEYSIREGGGQVTQLNLVRPDAFDPEPTAVTSGQGEWDELRGGV